MSLLEVAISRGLVADLPDFTGKDGGPEYFATDTGETYHWDGSSWAVVATKVITAADLPVVPTGDVVATEVQTGLENATTLAVAAQADIATHIINPSGAHAATAISGFDTQVRTNRLDQLTAPTADVSLNSHKLTNVTDPSSAQDAATKNYVDLISAGLRDFKQSVRVATTVAGTLATSFENGDTIDGVALVTGDRILIKNQAAGAENGIYTVAASGAPTRSTDADSSAEVTPGLFVFVEEGTVGHDTGWVLNTDAPITLGSTSLVFAQFTNASGGLLAANNLSDLASAATARTNLGLGNVDNTADIAKPVSTLQAAADAAVLAAALGLPLGLTGATQATRYVGATASGAPASGTFLKGDFVIAQDGGVYICTVAGSPGTWVAVTGGGGGGALTVEEVDGSPTDSAVTKIVFPNGTVGLVGHVATYTPAVTGSAVADAAYKIMASRLFI